MMHPIDKVHNKIVAGFVLNLYGEWVPRSVALKSKQQLLKQVFAGNVEINGEWVSLQKVRESWGQRDTMPDQQVAKRQESQPVKKSVEEKPQKPVEIVNEQPSQKKEQPQQKQRFSPLHNGVYDHGNAFLLKTTIQLNSETVLTISETEVQYNKVNVFAIDGFIDQSNCQKIHDEINIRMGADIRYFIFDLSRATLITSAGWGLLAAIKGQLSKLQGDLLIAAMSKEIEESFRLLQFGTILKKCSTNEECLSYVKSVVQKTMIESATAYVQGDRLMSVDGGVLPQDMPLQEKIKAIIAQYGPVSIGEIERILKEKEFGREKIGFVKLLLVLREMNLDTEEKRMRFYRSC